MSEAKGPEINWLAAAGSALGSVTSAVLLSTLGASGTIIGAGLGTLVITVGGTVYGHYLQRAKTNIEKTADNVKRNHLGNKKQSQQSDLAPITAQKDPEHTADSARATDKSKPSVKQVLRDISWKRVAWLAAGLFALTMVIIFVFELTTGRPVSSYTGGTSPDSTGTSLTGVTDPAREDPQWTPEQQHDSPETPPPTQVPSELEEDLMPDEQEPTATVDPEAPLEIPEEQPEEQTEQIPEQAPLQQEPAEPTQ